MQRTAGGQRLVVQHDRQVGRGALEHVFADDDDDHARRAGILLRAGVDQGVLGDIDRAADEIGGGIADQRHTGRRLRLA